MLNLSKNNRVKIKKEQSILFKTLQTPNAGKVLAKVLMSITGLFLILLFFPWQQNIRGNGKLTAFKPSERPQSVETAIAGRIASWRVIEGQFVNKGDTILTLTEVKDKFFNPELLERTKEQIDAKENSIVSKEAKASALRNQLVFLEQLRVAKGEQAVNKLQQAKYKLNSDSIDYEAEKIRFANQTNIFERRKQLYEAGNIALTKFQEEESKFQSAKMKQFSAQNKFLESRTEVVNARVNISGVEAEYSDKISKARSELNNTLSGVFESQASLAKLENEYANLTIRNEQYQILAPQDGYIVKAMKAGIGETVKAGESVVQIMPGDHQLAVEMYVKAMDIPLIKQGRKVRVQFDGWPALQFSGWPNVSVGTFGGEVQVIDRVNSKSGGFRILVTPDPDDEPWPDQLRIGGGTKGWVMLDNVRVWYEIWRQLNGFPPRFYEDGMDDSADKKTAEKK